jgi:DNA-binding protein H-NS
MAIWSYPEKLSRRECRFSADCSSDTTFQTAATGRYHGFPRWQSSDITLGGENFRSTCSPLPNTIMLTLFWEMEMARTNLGSMSVDALLKLRDDIEKVLSSKADELKNQLARLGSEIGPRMRGFRSSLKGRKVAIKYRDRSGNTWAGRGAQPVWLREKLKAGAKLEDFAVQTVASRKASPRKSKKRRRAKR